VQGANFRPANYKGNNLVAFSKNDIEHNAFPAGDTTCQMSESAAQFVFDGPVGVSAATQAACAAATTQVDCDAAASGGCIFNSTTNECKPAYLMQGSSSGVCDPVNTNVITGYAGETSTGMTGASVVGVDAVLGAWVNAADNTWKHSSPALTIDVADDAASFVRRDTACQGHNACVP